MTQNDLIGYVIKTNPKGGNSVLMKHFNRMAQNANEMQLGLGMVLKKPTGLVDILTIAPSPTTYSNCDGDCACKNCGTTNAINRIGADGTVENTPNTTTKFFEKNGTTLIIATTVLLAIYLATK